MVTAIPRRSVITGPGTMPPSTRSTTAPTTRPRHADGRTSHTSDVGHADFTQPGHMQTSSRHQNAPAELTA